MKWFELALIYLLTFGAYCQIRQIPKNMEFAGMSLTIDENARKQIQKQVDFLTKSPKYFNIKVQRARTYFPIIEKIFAEENLPDDFKFLALQESALVADAVSPTNAVGFWQFKDFTAKEMGLNVDHNVDERMNIYNSSYAAARYIKKCNYYFNNWIYALQSYNEGSGSVLRKLKGRDSGAREIEINADTFWYVKTFLAHKIAFEHDINESPDQPLTLITVKDKSISEIAKEAGIEKSQLLKLNKWLKTTNIPRNRDFAFLVPRVENQVFSFKPVFQTIKKKPILSQRYPNENIEDSKSTTNLLIRINGLPAIKASSDDEYYDLIKKGGISLSKFLQFNEILIEQSIQAGVIYFFKKKKKRASHALYTVKKGDNVWNISQRFGIQQKFLRKFNHIYNSEGLHVGMTLFLQSKIPKSPKKRMKTHVNKIKSLEDSSHNRHVKKPTSPDVKYSKRNFSAINRNESKKIIYEIESSDTLYSISQHFGVSVAELMKWNNKKTHKLVVGEKLKIEYH